MIGCVNAGGFGGGGRWPAGFGGGCGFGGFTEARTSGGGLGAAGFGSADGGAPGGGGGGLGGAIVFALCGGGGGACGLDSGDFRVSRFGTGGFFSGDNGCVFATETTSFISIFLRFSSGASSGNSNASRFEDFSAARSGVLASFLTGAKRASPSPSTPEEKSSCGGEPGGVLGSSSSPEAETRLLIWGHWLTNVAGINESPRRSLKGFPKCTVNRVRTRA